MEKTKESILYDVLVTSNEVS